MLIERDNVGMCFISSLSKIGVKWNQTEKNTDSVVSLIWVQKQAILPYPVRSQESD